MPTLQKQFGANLRAARERLGLTQEQLAAKAGLDRGHVNQIESGRQNASLATVEALAQAVGIPVHALMDPAAHSIIATPKKPG